MDAIARQDVLHAFLSDLHERQLPLHFPQQFSPETLVLTITQPVLRDADHTLQVEAWRTWPRKYGAMIVFKPGQTRTVAWMPDHAPVIVDRAVWRENARLLCEHTRGEGLRQLLLKTTAWPGELVDLVLDHVCTNWVQRFAEWPEFVFRSNALYE